LAEGVFFIVSYTLIARIWFVISKLAAGASKSILVYNFFLILGDRMVDFPQLNKEIAKYKDYESIFYISYPAQIATNFQKKC